MVNVKDMLPLAYGSGVYLGLFLIVPCFVKKGPNQGIIRCSILLTIFCMWIFWAIVYISQMNPLVGPRHANTTLIWMNRNKPQPKAPEKLVVRAGDKTRPRFCLNEPENLLECCNSPWLPEDSIANCLPFSVNAFKLTCEQARCAFHRAGWLSVPGTVEVASVAAYYDKLAATNPEWELAVKRIKTECLIEPKYQGIYMSCPEYDFMYCAMIRILKNGPLAIWSTAGACVPAKYFSANCPICPEECNMRDDFDDPSLIICHACLTF